MTTELNELPLESRLDIDDQEIINVRDYVNIIDRLKEKYKNKEFDLGYFGLAEKAVLLLKDMPEPTQTLVYRKHFLDFYQTVLKNGIIWGV